MNTLTIWCSKWYVILFCVFYVCRFAFKEDEGKLFVFPDLRCELTSSSRLVFVLHEALVKVTPISTWDFERMRSCAYMKEGNFARSGTFLGLEQRKKILSFLICCSFIFVGVVCISGLNRL